MRVSTRNVFRFVLGQVASLNQELTKKIAEGDMQAFEELYRRYIRCVYSLCLRMTQNVAEAEDITQEVFVHLFRKIGSFRGESAFMTWLYRLTTNHVLMHFRKRGARRELKTDDTTPVHAVEGGERAGRIPVLDHIALNKAVAQLSPDCRIIFILHDVEGYEHEEIGRMLRCTVGTSKSQLHKARKKLRELLGMPSADRGTAMPTS